MNSAAEDDKSFEIIKTPVDLRKKCKPLRGKAAEVDPIARAEQELARLSVRFDSWMEDETETLEKAYAAFCKDPGNEAVVDTLFRSAHDMRGQSETLGYPLAGRVASNLCRLIESAADRALIPPAIVEHHVLAVRAIVREKAKDEQNTTGTEIAKRLAEVVDEVLDKIGRHPDAP
ncbi:MAG: Hpt domain-containing protein [Hyphomicrobiales bacterium]